MDLPDPARKPDSFSSIMVGIDWIDDAREAYTGVHDTQLTDLVAYP